MKCHVFSSATRLQEPKPPSTLLRHQSLQQGTLPRTGVRTMLRVTLAVALPEQVSPTPGLPKRKHVLLTRLREEINTQHQYI